MAPLGYNTVWHGYAPYNPAMLIQYLNIFRTTHNYCNPGQDGATPAMKLGITDRPMTYDGVLWPGQVPPKAPVEEKVGCSPIINNKEVNKPKRNKTKKTKVNLPIMRM